MGKIERTKVSVGSLRSHGEKQQGQIRQKNLTWEGTREERIIITPRDRKRVERIRAGNLYQSWRTDGTQGGKRKAIVGYLPKKPIPISFNSSFPLWFLCPSSLRAGRSRPRWRPVCDYAQPPNLSSFFYLSSSFGPFFFSCPTVLEAISPWSFQLLAVVHSGHLSSLLYDLFLFLSVPTTQRPSRWRIKTSYKVESSRLAATPENGRGRRHQTDDQQEASLVVLPVLKLLFFPLQHKILPRRTSSLKKE